MSLALRVATPDDAGAIADIMLSDETDDFLRLQFGTVDPVVMSQGLEKRFEESIKSSGQVYVVAQDDGTGKIVSYSSWTLPRDEDELYVWQTEEEKAAAAEAYRAKLLDGMNVSLLMDFKAGLSEMGERALKGRRHYRLGNLGTLPSHRGKGAGTALTRWPFDKADREGVPVYLETDAEGKAKRLYERLGFKRIDEMVFDLSRYGASGVHTHIAMVREPQ